MRKLTVLVIAFSVFGCASSINLKTAGNYEQLAQREMKSGNLVLAEEYYGRALWNANMGKAPVSDISRITYNLGRVKALRCEHDEADALLQEALRLEESASGPESGLTSMRLFELARLNADRERYAEAQKYYARAIPIVRKLDIETSDPIGFADVLADYAQVLNAAGDADTAATIRKESDRIRSAHPQMRAGFVKISYTANCSRVQ